MDLDPLSWNIPYTHYLAPTSTLAELTPFISFSLKSFNYLGLHVRSSSEVDFLKLVRNKIIKLK